MICTTEELTEYLGDRFEVEPISEDRAKVHMIGKIATVDLSAGTVETEIIVRLYRDTDEENRALADEVLDGIEEDWKEAEFEIERPGRKGTFSFKTNPEVVWDGLFFSAKMQADCQALIWQGLNWIYNTDILL